MGDYAALHAAGGITVPDALYLLTKYAQFYTNALDTIQIKAIEISGLSAHMLKELCDQVSDEHNRVSIAIYYDQHTFVVSGASSAIEVLEERVRQMGATVQPYTTGGGLYSSLMNPVVSQLKMYLEKVDFKDLSIPLIMNTDGRPILKGSEIKQRFFEQLALPLVWDKTMQKMRDVDIIIQIEPKTDLTNRVLQKSAHNKHVVTINRLSDIQKLKSIIKSDKQMHCTRNGTEHGTV